MRTFFRFLALFSPTHAAAVSRARAETAAAQALLDDMLDAVELAAERAERAGDYVEAVRLRKAHLSALLHAA
jgi:hypothetical protein